MRFLVLLTICLILLIPVTSCLNNEEPVSPEPNPDLTPSDPGQKPEPTDSEDHSEQPKDPDPIEPVWAFVRNTNNKGDVWLKDAEGKERCVTNFGDVNSLSWSPDGQFIAFEMYFQGGNAHYELWVMNADGSKPQIIAKGYGIVWSPDSTSLAYREGTDLVVHNIFTDDKTIYNLGKNLTIGPWHPQGTYLALTDFDSVSVYVLNLETKDIVEVPNSESPHWREDSLVVAAVDVETEETEYAGGYTETLYFRYISGARVISLEDFSEQTILLPERITVRKQVEIGLSPSGRYVATSNSQTLWAIDLAEDEVFTLASQDEIITGTDFYVQFMFTWSPIQDLLMILPYTATNNLEGYHDISVIDMTSLETTLMISQAYFHRDGTLPPGIKWGPDGSYILEHLYEQQDGNLYQRSVQDGTTQLFIENTERWPQQRPGR